MQKAGSPSEQQSGSLVMALKQRHQSARCLLAQKAISVYLGTKTVFSHYVCCFILLQTRLKCFAFRKHLLAMKWTVTPTCWVVIDMISSASALGSAGKGSRLPDLGSDYKPPMSGKALSKAFSAIYGLYAVLLKFLKNVL